MDYKKICRETVNFVKNRSKMSGTLLLFYCKKYEISCRLTALKEESQQYQRKVMLQKTIPTTFPLTLQNVALFELCVFCLLAKL